MGFLDIFDHPDVLQYLLGGAPSGGPAGPPAPPPPVDPGQAMTPQTFTPQSPQQQYNMAQGGFPTNNQTEWNPPRATVPDTVAQVGPTGGGAQAATPPNASGGLPQRATVPDVLAPVGPQIASAPQQGPIETQPPPMPPPARPGAPAPVTQGGNLMAAFGLNPAGLRAANPLPTINPWQNALAGLGSGLAAVGNLRPGTNAATSFAAGMGGGVLGGLRQNQIQNQDVRQAHNDLFNQSNIAYRDMLAAYARNDAHGLAIARANWLNAGAQMRQMGGKDVFSGSPYAKSLKLENDLDRQDDIAGKQAYQQFQVNKQGSDPDAAIKTYNDTMASIKASRNQRRIEQAKRRGIDPDGYLAGSDQEHAFDYDKLTPEQRLRMPENSIYKWKDKDGNTQYGTRDYSQTPPYKGYQPAGQQQQQQQPSIAQSNEALYGGSDENDYGTEAA